MLFHMSILSCVTCGPVGIVVFTLPLLLSGAPLFLLSVFLFFFYLSGRHTRPGVLQLPDDTI